MRYVVDIDGTICNNTGGDYERAEPYRDRIERINKLYDDGNYIVYWTARGGNSGKDWSVLTRRQLSEWGCKYHELNMKKPVYDLWIDDKAVNSGEYFK